jgi:DNA-binding transcriptional ArsR family regulator
MRKVKQTFTDKQELIAKFASALSNPIRVAILELLSNQSCCYHIARWVQKGFPTKGDTTIVTGGDSCCSTSGCC